MKTIDKMIEEICGAIDGKMSPERDGAVRGILYGEGDRAESLVDEFCAQKTISRNINVPAALREIIAARKSKTVEHSEKEDARMLAEKYRYRSEAWETLFAQVMDTIAKYHTYDTARWEKDAKGINTLTIIRGGVHKQYGGGVAVYALFANYTTCPIFLRQGCNERREMDYMRYFDGVLSNCRDTWGVNEPCDRRIYSGDFSEVLRQVDDILDWRRAS